MLTPTQGSFTFPNHKDQTIIKFVDLVCAALKKICEKSDRSIKTGESGGGSEVDLGPDDVAVQRLVLVHLHNHPDSDVGCSDGEVGGDNGEADCDDIAGKHACLEFNIQCDDDSVIGVW